MTKITTDFDLDCRACLRLAIFPDDRSTDYPDYHARSMSQFGILVR